MTMIKILLLVCVEAWTLSTGVKYGSDWSIYD